MKSSASAVLTAGVVALTGSALMFTPSILPATMRTVEVVRPVSFAADSAPIPQGGPVQPFSATAVTAALALIDQLAPGDREGSRIFTAAVPTGRAVDTANPIAAEATADEPQTQNAASNIIDAVYAVSRYWANYVSLELGPWLINWIPFGYLISDQIYIWYPDFVLPVVDSFVYDFLDPVVNDPLNLAVWIDGIGAIINTAIDGVVNGIVSEVDYFLSLQWLPFPIPPLPGLPLTALASESTPAAALVAPDEADVTATDEAVADETGEEASQPVDPDTAVGTEAPAQEAIDEDVVDDTEAPTDETLQQDPETPSEDADNSDDEVIEEASDETSDESVDPQETTDDEAGDAGDSGDAGQGGDNESGSGQQSGDNASDDASASGTDD